MFVDANIFVDVLADRDDWYENSAEIINRVETGTESGCISALTVPILWYVMGEKAEHLKEIKDIIKNFKIIPLTSQLINTSFNSEMKDFEDSIQLYSAIKGKCNTLITRNKRDFRTNTKISILTPDEFLVR